MLFSSTLSVRASSGVNNITDLVQFTNPILSTGNTYFTFKVPYWQLHANNNKYDEFEVTISPTIDTRNIEIDPYKTYCVMLSTNGQNPTATYVGGSQTVGADRITGGSIVFKSINGTVLSMLQNSGDYIFRGYALVQGIELLNGYTSSYNTTCNFTCVVGFHHITYVGGASPSGAEYWNVRLPYSMDIFNLKEAYQYMNTTDMETKRQIQQSEQVIDNTLQEGNEIASDTNETTHSIFDSISDFFGSFFSNLIGVFVPEDGYFSNWFSRLNTLLEDKLGILYWPFSKIIAFFNRLTESVSSQSNVTITFPAIEFTNLATNETYHILDEQTVSLEYYNYRVPLSGGSPNSDLVGSNRFNSLVSIVRTFNSAVLIFGLLSLLRKKLNLILRGDDNDN